jgi:hypothetical protein
MSVLQSIVSNPVLAVIGFAVVIVVLFAPIALRIAGLSGAQIVDLLKATAGFAVNLASVLRCSDDTSDNP